MTRLTPFIFISSLLLANSSLAAISTTPQQSKETKIQQPSTKEIREAEKSQKEWDKKLEEFKKFEDPDLKLSIEELKKKYPPVDWLYSKYGYYGFCEEYCMGEENCEIPPANLVCRFSISKPNRPHAKTITQFIFRNFSENQIKDIFINFNNTTNGHDDRRAQIVFLTYDYFYRTPISSLSSKERKLASFIFSDLVIENIFLGKSDSIFQSKLNGGNGVKIDDVFYSESGLCRVVKTMLPSRSEVYFKIAKEYISTRQNIHPKHNIFECINPAIINKLNGN